VKELQVEDAIAGFNDANEQDDVANEQALWSDEQFDAPDAGFNRAAVEFNGAEL
jgi:hypothetical protein